MHSNVSGISIEKTELHSTHLQRKVSIDFYQPVNMGSNPLRASLLLINDGQNLLEMGFPGLLEQVEFKEGTEPVMAVGIHADKNRKREYGVAGEPDYLGRGDLAGQYTSFILQELLPLIERKFTSIQFTQKIIAGFSLGALSALDIAWSHPGVFDRVALFSGSLWWRSVSQDDPSYDDDKHRIMHQKIRKGNYIPGLKFFFQCGNMDETMDRNNNGIIDSIDDTQDLIRELVKKGYDAATDITYLEMAEGKHDLPTWAKALRVLISQLVN